MAELGPNINESPFDPLQKGLDENVTVADLEAIFKAVYGNQRSIKRVWDLIDSYSRRSFTDAEGIIWEALMRPVGATDLEPGGPLTLYRKPNGKIGVVWGVVNSLVPDNIEDEWATTNTDTYFFVQASLQSAKARLVTNATIVTGSSISSYATADFNSGTPPSYAYFPIGYANNDSITNSGRGNLEFHVITSRMYSTSELHVDYRVAIYRTG